VRYFYPKDDTPGCRRRPAGSAMNSPNSGLGGITSWRERDRRVPRKIQSKYRLIFPCSATADKQGPPSLGVWKEKSSYGKKRMGVERTTSSSTETGRSPRCSRASKAGPRDEVLKAFGHL